MPDAAGIVFKDHPTCKQCPGRTVAMAASREGLQYKCENGHSWWEVKIDAQEISNCMNEEMKNLLKELETTNLTPQGLEFVRILLQVPLKKKRFQDYLVLLRMTQLSFRADEIIGLIKLGIESRKYQLEE